MKNVWMFVASLVLVGCAGMADSVNRMAGIGVVSQDHSSFDGSHTVEVSPSWMYEQGVGVKTVNLGARWTSAVPEYAVMVLQYKSSVGAYSSGDAYTRITGIDVNVGGEINSFEAGRPTKLDSDAYNIISESISTTSTNQIVVPLSFLYEMVEAEDCRIRVHTSDGYEDSHFSIERQPGGQATAIVAYREFLKRVETLNN